MEVVETVFEEDVAALAHGPAALLEAESTDFGADPDGRNEGVAGDAKTNDICGHLCQLLDVQDVVNSGATTSSWRQTEARR